MNDQAAGIRSELARSLRRPPAPFVLLTGGKGGVGKTTIAANLGVELARGGLRVLLVDLDLGLANLNVVLRMTVRCNVEEFFAGERPLAECVARGPGGVHLLPAGSGTADMGRPSRARRERLFDALAEVAPQYDLLLGDSAAGIGADVLAFAAAADRVLVVTADEPAALTDAYGVIKALHTTGLDTGREVATPELVVNFADGSSDAEETAGKLRSVSERFLARSPRLAGWIPRCAAVQRSQIDQTPFVLGSPHSLSSRCIAQLGRRLGGARVEGAA